MVNKAGELYLNKSTKVTYHLRNDSRYITR